MTDREITGEDLLKILALVAAGYLSYKVIKIFLEEAEKQRKNKK
jgi:hypothetical protein